MIRNKKEWWIKPKDKPVIEDQTLFDKNVEHQQFYKSKRWADVRNYVKNTFGCYCDCGAIITDERYLHIHHVHNISDPTGLGWLLRFSVFDDNGERNLLVKCINCHARISAEERREVKEQERQRITDDIMNELKI